MPVSTCCREREVCDGVAVGGVQDQAESGCGRGAGDGGRGSGGVIDELTCRYKHFFCIFSYLRKKLWCLKPVTGRGEDEAHKGRPGARLGND